MEYADVVRVLTAPVPYEQFLELVSQHQSTLVAERQGPNTGISRGRSHPTPPYSPCPPSSWGKLVVKITQDHAIDFVGCTIFAGWMQLNTNQSANIATYIDAVTEGFPIYIRFLHCEKHDLFVEWQISIAFGTTKHLLTGF